MFVHGDNGKTIGDGIIAYAACLSHCSAGPQLAQIDHQGINLTASLRKALKQYPTKHDRDIPAVEIAALTLLRKHAT